MHALDRNPLWKIPVGALCVAFVDERQCAELHHRFFDDPELTDVMTFPGEPRDGHCGDVVICAPFAVQTAAELGQKLESELLLYLVHGWLHLAGLQDGTDSERREMRKAEKWLLRFLEAKSMSPRAVWTNQYDSEDPT